MDNNVFDVVSLNAFERELYSDKLKFVPVQSKKNTYKLNKKICITTQHDNSSNDNSSNDNSKIHNCWLSMFDDRNKKTDEKYDEYNYYKVSFVSTEYRDYWTFEIIESDSEEIKSDLIQVIELPREIVKFSNESFPLIVKRRKMKFTEKVFTYYQIKGYRLGNWTVDLVNNKIYINKNILDCVK